MATRKPSSRASAVPKTTSPKVAKQRSPRSKAKLVVAKPVSAAQVATKPQETAGTKHKLIRDSFTIPKGEFEVLGELKQRAGRLEHPVKKSELLRAGIGALSGMADKSFLSALNAVPNLKTGRPKEPAASAGRTSTKKA